MAEEPVTEDERAADELAEEPRRGEASDDVSDPSTDDAVPAGDRPRWRVVATVALTVLAGLLVWFALVGPNRLSRLTPIEFVRIPAEGLILVALFLVLPQRGKRIVAAVVGLVLAVVSILKILDMGFYEALGQPFNPIYDRSYFGSAVGLLTDAVGHSKAIFILIAAAILVVGLLILMPLAVIRLTRLVDRHRTTSFRVAGVLAIVWGLCAVLGVQLATDAPLASGSAAGLVRDQVSQVRASLRDEQAFKKDATIDAVRGTPRKDLLTSLRGKDVMIVFVESYGRVAVQDSAFSPGVDAVLDAGNKKLQASGFAAKSAFLTSPTFGGISWLAHSTLQSGLWINNQGRYNALVSGDRFTLSGAFKRAGWRTVGDVPSNTKTWPEGKTFYHYDKVYDATNVGYQGPKFSYAQMPDQYIMSALQRNELAKPNHRPVMAEIDLESSHTPWAPLPHLINWADVGNGSVFDSMPAQGQSPGAVWRHAADVRTAYGQSIQYSMNTLVSFVQQAHDNNLVMVVLGDHQPATIVSGEHASRDVPISIIAHDPAVLKQISGWGWQDGIHPNPDAVVWPMDAFRDRFITAYSPRAPKGPVPSGAAAKH